MRIAFISDLSGYSWAGCEDLWADAALEALRNGHSVAFFQSRDKVDPERMKSLLDAGLEWIKPPIGARFVNLLRRRVSWKLASCFAHWSPSLKTLRNFHPDIIFITVGTSIPGLDFLQSLERSNIHNYPYVICCHNSFLFGSPVKEAVRQSASTFYLRARRVLFVAKRTYEETEHLLATRLDHVTIVRNPVNLIDTSAVPMPPIEPAVCIACVGRLQLPTKGLDILLAALGSPQFQARNWQLSLYGSGPHQHHLELLAEHYKIADRVTFCGQVSDVRSIWEKNHILALPSRNESAPLVIVEATLCSRPVIANDVGGVREWITDSEGGYLSDGIDIDSFQSALERAWADKDRWEALGLRAREKTLAQLDPTPGKTVLDILRAAIQEPSAPSTL